MELQVDKRLWNSEIIQIMDYLAKLNPNKIYDSMFDKTYYDTLDSDFKFYRKYLRLRPAKLNYWYEYLPLVNTFCEDRYDKMYCDYKGHVEAENAFDESINYPKRETPWLVNTNWPYVKDREELMYMICNLVFKYKFFKAYPKYYHEMLYSGEFISFMRSQMALKIIMLQNDPKINYQYDLMQIYRENIDSVQKAKKLDTYLDYVCHDIKTNLDKYMQIASIKVDLRDIEEIVWPGNKKSFELGERDQYLINLARDIPDRRKYDLLRVTRFLKSSKDYLPKAIHAIDKYSGTWNGFLPDLYKMWPTTADLINQLICILGNLDSAPWEDCVINATIFHAFLTNYELAKPSKHSKFRNDLAIRTMCNLIKMFEK